MRNFWEFLRGDSWGALVVTLLLAFILIKFIFFPALSLVTGTSLPLVIVESCSMYHEDGLEEVLENSLYGRWGIDFEDTACWDFRDGMSKGDVIFVVGVDEVEVGDVIIFMPEGSTTPYPIIHRVVSLNPIQTKGDHNDGQLNGGNNAHGTDETNISKDRIIGKALFKVPLVGWAKLIFFEGARAPSERGLC